MRDKLREWDEIVRQELFEKGRRENDKNQFYFHESRLDKLLGDTSNEIRATEAKLRELESVLDIASLTTNQLPPPRPPSANQESAAAVPPIQIMTPIQIQQQLYPTGADQANVR